jgi:hypothetical protein
MTGLKTGYDTGLIEPKIAPLVQAVQDAGLATFSSCEGHIEDANESFPRWACVGFFADEERARRVHTSLLRYRSRLACSWDLRGTFVLHRENVGEFALGWILENCGSLQAGEPDEFHRRTVKDGWDRDIPMLIEMFNELHHKELR